MNRTVFNVHYQEHGTDISSYARIEVYDDLIHSQEFISDYKDMLADFYDVRKKFIKTDEEVKKQEEDYKCFENENQNNESRLPGIDKEFYS